MTQHGNTFLHPTNDIELVWADFPNDDHGRFFIPAAERTWPISMEHRARLALAHEPKASASPDGFRLATCVVPNCKNPMVAMWHLWLKWFSVTNQTTYIKEIHMCHKCATDIYGAPTPNDPVGLLQMLTTNCPGEAACPHSECRAGGCRLALR